MEPIKRVMVDLETLSSGPTAVIVSIGAVKMTDLALVGRGEDSREGTDAKAARNV